MPQDELYTFSWEADFDYQVFEPRQDDNPNEATQAPDNNASGATGDYDIYDKADANAVRSKPATSRDGITSRDADDVTEGNYRCNTNEYEVRLRTATSRDALLLHDEDDVNENAARDEQRSEKEWPNTATSRD